MYNQAADARYKDFLDSIQNDEYVLFLEAGDGMTASYASAHYFNNETQEPVPIIPVWSEGYREQAIASLEQNWKDCELLEVPVSAFLSDILPEMAKACIFLGINIDEGSDMDIEIDPLDIFRELGLIDDDAVADGTTSNDN